jgi:hypothetical protein
VLGGVAKKTIFLVIQVPRKNLIECISRRTFSMQTDFYTAVSVGYIFGSYLEGNTSLLHQKLQPNRLMTLRETVAIWCENRTEDTDSIRTSQETHYVFSTKTNRLMLFGETVAVYCENRTEHTDSICTSQETHYVSSTETNRLMLFGETVAVYYENHMEHRKHITSLLQRQIG